MGYKPNKSVETNRRSVLKKLSISGITLSLTGANLVSASEDTIEVPIAKRGEKVILTEKVSEDWWEHVKESREGRKEIFSRFGSENSVGRIKTVLGEGTIAGNQKLKTVVEIDRDESGALDLHNADPDIPDQANGIPVEVEQAKEEAYTVCKNRGTYDEVKGGYTFGHNSNGTAGWRVYWEDDPYILTAAHLFHEHEGDFCYGGLTNEKAHQGDQLFGEATSDYDTSLDYALVEQTNDDVSLGTEVENSRGNTYMDGHITNYEVLMEDGETIHKTGKTTGYTSGEITSITTSTSPTDSCIDIDRGECIEYSMNQAEGDSGSAPYVIRETSRGNEVALTTGLATVGRNQYYKIGCDGGDHDAYDKTLGASAEAIKDDMGSDFYFEFP